MTVINEGGGGDPPSSSVGTDDALSRGGVGGGADRATRTYVAGLDPTRLASAARYFGLQRRQQRASAEDDDDAPRRSTTTSAAVADSWGAGAFRRNVGWIFLSDATLESARMHSVGVTAREERIDEGGTLHLMSTARRRRGDAKPLPEYGALTDLFHREPLEVEVRPSKDEPEEYEEVVLDSVEGGSMIAAVFGIIKGTVGPAILYLPRGFQLSGYAVAVPAMLLSTVSYLYSARRLLECWKVESDRMHERANKLEEIKKLLEIPSIDRGDDGGGGEGAGYGSTDVVATETDSPDTTETTTTPAKLLTYPELARRAFGPRGSYLVTFGVAAMQFGVCLTYLIFVPANLIESTRELFGVTVSKLYFLVGMVLVEIPLVWIRDIRKLHPLNVLATSLIGYGLAMCLVLAVWHRDDDDDPTDEAESLFEKIQGLPAINDTWYLFIGTSFFVFEGAITLLVPLQEAVYKQEDKDKFPDVNRNVTFGIVTFYLIFAITCWASFGESVQTALTASLPRGPLTTTIQLAYSVAVIFTFPLQAFPALEVVCRTTDEKTGKGEDDAASHEKIILKRDVVASLIVIFLGVVAYLAIDYLGNVVSLLGSLVGIPIALIYPPLMHNILVTTKDDTSSPTRGVRAANVAVAMLGLVATGAASYTTIVSWDEGAEG